MALLTRSMILVLFFFLLITHSHSHSHSLTHSLSFIDNAAYVRFGVGSRQRVRHINACPTTTRGTVGNERERRTNERTIAKRKREKEKTKMRAQKKGRRYSFFSFLFLFLPFFIDSTYSNYLQFRSDGRIARNTFWWKIIVTVTFIQKWFASMHSTSTSCCCFTSCICICGTMLLLTMWWCWWYAMMRIKDTTWWWWTIHIKTKRNKNKKNIYLIILINYFIKNDLLISRPHHSTGFWAFSFSNVNKMLDVLLSGGKNTCIIYIHVYGYMYMSVCKCHSNLINKRISDNRRRR